MAAAARSMPSFVASFICKNDNRIYEKKVGSLMGTNLFALQAGHQSMKPWRRKAFSNPSDMARQSAAV